MRKYVIAAVLVTAFAAPALAEQFYVAFLSGSSRASLLLRAGSAFTSGIQSQRLPPLKWSSIRSTMGSKSSRLASG